MQNMLEGSDRVNMEMISVGRLALCAVDVYMLYSFFKTMFKLRNYNVIMYVLFSVMVTVQIFFINAYSSTLLNLVVIPILYMLFALLMFKLSLAGVFTYTVIYYAIFSGGREVAYEMLFRLISNYTQFEIPPWFTSEGFYFLLPEYVLGFLFLLLIERSLKKLDIGEYQEFAWYLLVMPVSSLIVLSTFLYIDFPDSVSLQKLMCIGAFLLYFSNAEVFIVLAKYKSIMNLAKYEEMSNLKQAMEDDKFQNIASLHKLYRDYIHDIHLCLRQIRVFASNKQHKKIIEIVDKLEGEIQMGGHNIIYNTNEVLNTILAEYVLEAQNKGIELSVFVEDCLNVDFISDADMISMFGNLLNNALEATAKCEAGHRKADVKLFMGNQYMLVLYIKNSFLVSVQWEGEELLTTKKEKQFHGMGIGIVKRLAEKYGGTLMLEEKGSNFITTLIISACKK